MGDVLENEEYSYIVTERDFVSILIDLYRNRPELWKVKHIGYLDKQQKARALDEMVKELQSYRPDFNKEQVRKKINILRTNFNKERRKVAAARRRGDDEYKPHLWYYNELLFLSDEAQGGNFKSSDTEDTLVEQKYLPDSDFQDTTVQSPSTTRQHTNVLKTITVKRRKINLEEEEEDEGHEKSEPEQYMTVTTTYYKKPKTKEDILAKHWAMKLKKLSGEQKLFAEKIINDVLFEGELGNLTKNGVSF